MKMAWKEVYDDCRSDADAFKGHTRIYETASGGFVVSNRKWVLGKGIVTTQTLYDGDPRRGGTPMDSRKFGGPSWT
jgi:hypothetical protein